MLDEPVSVRMAWIGTEELPVLFANQFLFQVGPPGEVFITVGQVVPPAVIGSPQEQQQQLQALPFVPVKPVVRLGMSRARLRELITSLGQLAEVYDQTFGGEAP